MRKYIFNEAQYEEILGYLAEQEELQKKSLDHLTPIMEENIMEKFMNSMDVLFAQYAKDGVMDNYHRDGHSFTVGKKDSAYLWSALDGAIHLWNSLHREEDALRLDSYGEEDTDTYIIQYVVDDDSMKA